MDLSLSVSPEPVSGDWSPAAAAASPSADGAAFGAMLGDAVAGAPMPVASSTAVPGTAHPLDAAALLAFMGAPVDMAPQEGTLVPGMLSDLAGLTGAVGDAITGEPVDAAADTGEDSLDEAGLAVVVATAPPDLSSALPWGIPVAVPGSVAADTTGACAAAPDGADIASHLRAVEVSASAGSALTSGSMIGTGATPDGTTPFSRLQGHGAERAGAHQAGVADGEAIALPGVISPATDAQVPSAELAVAATTASLAADASLVTDAAHLPSGGDAPVTRRKSGAGANEPWGVPMTGASSAMRADALRSILGQAAPAEGGDAPVADLAAALTRRESGAPRAAMMLAQALRPLEAPTVGQNGTDRLESMLASRDLEATMDAELPSQLIDAIRLQARSGVQEARIRLRPEVLGEVSIAISVAGGAVSATIEAESPAVRQWVERHEGLLRERLSDQGLQLAQLEVKADDRQRDGERQRREQRDASKPAVMNRAQREAAAQRFAAML